MKAALFVSVVAASDVDCSSTACPSTCSCVETKCDSMYSQCTGDSQCNGIMNCLMSCSCSDLVCGLGCVAGKTLDSVSSSVKSCAEGCASSLDEQWEAYKSDFKKVYADDVDEATRKQLFSKSLERIERLNKANGNYAFGLTRESDRHDNEKHAKGAVRPKEHKSAPVKAARNPAAPAVVDWRSTIAVTPIKNQGQCGSCWAFSATEAIESQYVLDATPEYAIEFSPQQITSCVTSCDGCNGGWPYAGYEYIESVAGLSNEWYWPYTQSMIATSATAACATNVSIFDGPDAELAGGHATVTGYNYVIPECSSGACANQDMQGLAAAVAEGPLSICVNAGAWNDYTGGVMSTAACGGYAADDLDHCVQLVGYNSTASSPYWIVKNSWSTTWGRDGYIFLEYPANTCGIGNEATRPVIGNAAGNPAARERLVNAAVSGRTMPDCTSASCPSVCSCVESKCASLYDGCTADSQCNGILTCMLGCGCDDTACSLGCVAGSTLDSVSAEVKTCGSACLSTVV